MRASRSHLVLGRQPPAALGIVAGADGAAARARGQCRRRHHGRKLQPHVPGLARRTARGGRLCQRRQTTRRRPTSRHGCASGPRWRRSCRAAAPTRRWLARRSRCWACPITPTYRDNWPLLQSAANAWVRLRPGDAVLRQRAIGAAAEACRRRPHRSAGARRQLAAGGRRHLCRLRQSQRARSRSTIAALTRRFPEIPLTRMGLRVAPRENSGADRRRCRKNSGSTTATSPIRRR